MYVSFVSSQSAAVHVAIGCRCRPVIVVVFHFAVCFAGFLASSWPLKGPHLSSARLSAECFIVSRSRGQPPILSCAAPNPIRRCAKSLGFTPNPSHSLHSIKAALRLLTRPKQSPRALLPYPPLFPFLLLYLPSNALHYSSSSP